MTDLPVPKISVIIPIYQQWDFLPDLIAALAAQEFPLRSWAEVLLIDNDPADPAPRPALPDWIRLLPCPTPGSYAARNMGAAMARGRLLVFTDADCRPHPGWLSALHAAAENRDPGGLLAGLVTMPVPKGASVWQIFDAVRGIPQASFVSRGYAATANLAMSRTLFEILGGFDARRLSGGDAEFCRRAGRQGHTLTLVPGATVDHLARDSFTALALKARRIKGGQVASGPLRRRIFWTLRSLVPPLREAGHYLRSEHALRHRLIATGVRVLLWGVELHEITRLLLTRRPPERR
ncbi:glycosyltransferase family 2 protein [Cereibacter azotoformans]|uniref:glycosyltransferase family 2 protein n=1 Tax=Cereibacter azotoformans TaxID=43057 RepID=UPI000C6EFEC3|nr:glycosyltransferase [Cereibacter azotoformans]